MRLETYAHLLESAEDVVEWVRGSHLTDYQERLAPVEFARFVDRYRERLLALLGPLRPYLFTYDRLFLWGTR